MYRIRYYIFNQQNESFQDMMIVGAGLGLLVSAVALPTGAVLSLVNHDGSYIGYTSAINVSALSGFPLFFGMFDWTSRD